MRSFVKAPAFQFYPKDYLLDAKVRAMSLEERGAYWEICSHLWLEKELPRDTRHLARILGVSHKKMERLWGAMKSCFVVGESTIRHARLDLERLKQEERRLENQRASQKRWRSVTAVGESDGNAHAMHIDSSSSPTATPSPDASSTAVWSSTRKPTPNGDAAASKSQPQVSIKSVETPAKRPPSVIWDLGLTMLVEGAMGNANARSLLGRLARDYGKGALAQAVASASSQNLATCKQFESS
jgi:uncharacterized protein YdaU (DUF1376 family)